METENNIQQAVEDVISIKILDTLLQYNEKLNNEQIVSLIRKTNKITSFISYYFLKEHIVSKVDSYELLIRVLEEKKIKLNPLDFIYYSNQENKPFSSDIPQQTDSS